MLEFMKSPHPPPTTGPQGRSHHAATAQSNHLKIIIFSSKEIFQRNFKEVVLINGGQWYHGQDVRGSFIATSNLTLFDTLMGKLALNLMCDLHVPSKVIKLYMIIRSEKQKGTMQMLGGIFSTLPRVRQNQSRWEGGACPHI